LPQSALPGCLTDLRDARLPLALFHFPLQASDSTFDVASRANQIILERDFLQTPVAGAPQSVASAQFAVGAFNAMALLHLLLKCSGLHLVSPGLERGVVLAHH
jgi:hypothetical protein